MQHSIIFHNVKLQRKFENVYRPLDSPAFRRIKLFHHPSNCFRFCSNRIHLQDWRRTFLRSSPHGLMIKEGKQIKYSLFTVRWNRILKNWCLQLFFLTAQELKGQCEASSVCSTMVHRRQDRWQAAWLKNLAEATIMSVDILLIVIIYSINNVKYEWWFYRLCMVLIMECVPGLPHPGKVLESPGFFLLSWKVLESPWILFVSPGKVLENVYRVFPWFFQDRMWSCFFFIITGTL